MPLKLPASVITVLLLSPLFVSAQAMSVPTLIFTISKSSMVATVNPVYDNLPTISWSSGNATSCRASGAGWSGITPLSGSQKVNPSVTTTYTMTCTNASWSTARSVTLNVTPATANLQTAGVLGGYQQLMDSTQSMTAPAAQGQSSFRYVWNRNLQIGSPYTQDISALQTTLTNESVYSGEITGKFYNQTFAAVKRFQRKYSINPTGFVGPQTRAKLNALYGN